MIATLAPPKVPDIDEILEGAAHLIERDGHQRGYFQGRPKYAQNRLGCPVCVIGAICYAAGLQAEAFTIAPDTFDARFAAAVRAAAVLVDYLGLAGPGEDVDDPGFLIHRLGYGWSDVTSTTVVLAELRAAAAKVRERR